jgi:hypothetical protein
MNYSEYDPWPFPQVLDKAWKTLTARDALAYYDTELITAVKMFYSARPREGIGLMNNNKKVLPSQAEIPNRTQRYKTFYGRNLFMFVIS